MAFTKISSPNDWNQFHDQTSAMVKVSSFGLKPNDASDLRKIAGDRFVHEIKQIEDQLHKNCAYVHVVSCGSSEKFSCNRNGDGWRADVLERDMPTYVKHAKLFREHNNRKDSPYYGRVKLAFFDSDRGYGRCLAEYNANQAAADTYGGLVADKELQKLARDGEASWSHGTHVGKDVCIICDNIATKKSEYCLPKSEGGKCDLFGCRNGLTKVAEDGRIQYVDNPNNVFYDLSFVATPADRIAYGTSISDWDKTGSFFDLDTIKYLPRFDLVVGNYSSSYHVKLAQTAAELATLESNLNLSDLNSDFSKQASVISFMGDPSQLIEIRALVSNDPYVKRGAAYNLARKKQLPSAGQLAKAAGASPEIQQQADIISIGLIERLCSENMISNLIKSSAFTERPLAASPHYLVQIVDAPGYCYSDESLNKRALNAAVSNETLPDFNKLASCNNETAAEFALEHAALKIAISQKLASDENFSLIFLSYPQRT